jgi:hypothetical protein
MDTKNSGQVILAVLFIIYLVVGYKIPPSLAVTVNLPVTRIILLFLALYLFVIVHPLVAILGVGVVIHLLMQSSKYSSSYTPGIFGPDLAPYYPTEKRVSTYLNPAHQFPYTLEQEVVKRMTTLHQYNDTNQTYTFKPVLDETHNASSLHQQNELLHGVPKLGCS